MVQLIGPFGSVRALTTGRSPLRIEAGVGVAAAGEAVRTKVDVVALVGQDVPDGDEHGVGDDEDRLGLALLGETLAEPPVLGGVAAIPGMSRRPGRLDKRRAQRGVALARLA